MKPLSNFLDFLSFTGLTQTYLVKTSITHNNHSTPQFLEDNDPISTKFAAPIFIFKSGIDFFSFEFFNQLILQFFG